jgi:hypothetical protein
MDNQEAKTKIGIDFVGCGNVFVAICSFIHLDGFSHKCFSFATFHVSNLFDWLSSTQTVLASTQQFLFLFDQQS